MKRVILSFAASFAMAFTVGFSQGGEQARPDEVSASCDQQMCEDLCHGAAFCSDWGCVCM